LHQSGEVVQRACLADRFGEDLVSGLDPGERSRAGVPLAGEALDGGGEGVYHAQWPHPLGRERRGVQPGAAGTYTFVCQIHDGMKGTLLVN
jgi:hypothetical protein